MNDQRESSQQLAGYIDSFNTRLKRLHLSRALAAIMTAFLLVTLGGVYLAIQRGFADYVLYATRALLLLSAAGLGALLWLRPWRAIQRRPAAAVETLTPEFAGRVETWTGMQGESNPLKSLLAEDALGVANQHPADQQVKRWLIAAPAAVAAISAAVLLWLAISGPGLYGYGVRHVWAGWAIKGLLPDQGILVTPGNEAVRRGGSVPVLATVHGFNPVNAQLFARVGAGAWQQVDMTHSPRGFEFTFLSVREPVNYYVTAAGVRSPSYTVDVVEVPNIENLKVVYQYPSWTHKKSAVDDPGGDVAAVAGTAITLEIRTDRPIGAGTLVLNGKDTALSASGSNANGNFTIDADGRYYIAARVGRETVRLTDDYLIKLVPDNKPEIRIVKPGRDATASSIEEVAARVQATDDFALEKVDLHYAINGGAWQVIPIPGNGAHVEATETLMLEQLRVASEDRALAAGDVISYYAAARDRAQSAQTDMYFVEVRPYDRKFTQSQQSGGGGGGDGDQGGQTEISRRQKEILVSTWNLIRQKADKQASAAPAAIKDNSLLLSDVQQKLAAQAESLASRAEARELDASDEQIKSFVGLMKDAAKSMQPASQRLATTELEQAIQPEQLALQYLLRAEAVYSDIELQMQQSQGGGGQGGGQSGNDLAQLYDLEMDLQKNQYESANSASPGQSAQQQDDVARKLAELARRQEQLARDATRSQTLTDEQRWQQEALKREAEQLQQQLNSLQQQASNQQGQSGQQSGQQGQAGASGQGTEQASRQLQQAIQAMNRANEAMRNNNDPDQQRAQLQRAANEARQQLNGASQQLSQQKAESLRSQLAALNDQAERALATQSASESQLQEAASAAAASRTRSEGREVLGADQRKKIAADKRALSDDVQRLEQDLSAAARKWRGESPATADSATEASQILAQNQVQQQLTQSAQYIDRGLAAFIVPRESGLTDSLREVRDVLRAAQSGAQGATESQRANGDLQSALSRVQSLREQVQQLANANATGQRGQPGQQGQEGQAGQQGGGMAGGTAGLQRDVGAAGRQVGGLGSILRGQGASPQDVRSIADLARQLQGANFAGQGETLNRQLQASLRLLEQLETKISQSTRGANRQSVRTAVNDPVTDEYRDAVAEYYRQLSKD